MGADRGHGQSLIINRNIPDPPAIQKQVLKQRRSPCHRSYSCVWKQTFGGERRGRQTAAQHVFLISAFLTATRRTCSANILQRLEELELTHRIWSSTYGTDKGLFKSGVLFPYMVASILAVAIKSFVLVSSNLEEKYDLETFHWKCRDVLMGNECRWRLNWESDLYKWDDVKYPICTA